MASNIDIINRALARLGADKIASLDEESVPAQTAADLYPEVRDDLLARHRWSFLTGQAQLARLPAAPLARFTAAYQIPPGVDNVKAVTINDAPIRFDRQDDKILCDATASEVVILEYTDLVVEDRWPGWFCTLMSYELASVFAIPVGDRADLAEWYEKKSLRHFGLCKQLDAQGKTSKRLPTGRYKSVRFGGGRF